MDGMRAVSNPKARGNWERSIGWFLTGQGVSQIGSGLVQFAVIWYVATKTGSGSAMTAVIVASFVPQLLVALFAGVWADRFNRKWIIALADAGIAIATLVIAILFMIGKQSIWQIYVISAIRSLGGGIQGPAVSAAIPQLVPREQLVRINGIQSTIGNATQLLSPILGGLALTLLPMFGVFMIDVVTATIAIILLVFIPFPKQHGLYVEPLEKLSEAEEMAKAATQSAVSSEVELNLGSGQESGWQSLKEGVRYIRESRLISVLMSIYAGFMFLLAPTITLMALYLKRNFGEEEWYLTVAQTSLFAGMVLGGLIVSWIGKFKHKLRVIQMAGFSLALAIIGLGLLGAFRSPLFSVFAAIAFVAGTVVPFYTTNVTVLIQEETPPDRHGRVFAVLFMVGSAAIPAGSIVFGPLADLISVEAILFATGLLQIALVLLSTRLLPDSYNEPSAALQEDAESVDSNSDPELIDQAIKRKVKEEDGITTVKSKVEETHET